jgi:hypothetical protein
VIRPRYPPDETVTGSSHAGRRCHERAPSTRPLEEVDEAPNAQGISLVSGLMERINSLGLDVIDVSLVAPPPGP